jgi:DNA polymerase III delta prime subunit
MSLPPKPQCPHLLLCGPSYSGKSTLAKQYGAEHFQGRVFTLDAAFDGGVDTFRDEIQRLSRQKQELSLCIVENADLLTDPCQQAMRRIMEKQSHLIRFAFCVWSDPHQLIPAICSRCVYVACTAK